MEQEGEGLGLPGAWQLLLGAAVRRSLLFAAVVGPVYGPELSGPDLSHRHAHQDPS